MPRTVVVTGLNLITALGFDLESVWRGLLRGESGVRRITRFDASPFPTRIAAEVPEGLEDVARNYCTKRFLKQSARGTWLGYTCARAAMEQHRIDPKAFDPVRCGVVFGTADPGHSRIDPQDYWILKTMPHAVPALLSMEYGWRGPNLILSAACASSAYAISYAADQIACGRADLMIAGGASCIVDPEHVAGFSELRALSTANDDPSRASRPFSRGRDGFVIGEGAGVLVLEAVESALARGALIYGILAGSSITNEAYNLMSPRPEGAGMAEAMRRALEHAGMDSDEIDCINAHGTSTTQNDRCETQAIRDVFGDRADHIPISAPKSMLGHTAGACGAVEAVITLMSLKHGVVTPTINYDPDPELTLDYVPHAARQHPQRAALSNSFGFGGCNATLVFRNADALEAIHSPSAAETEFPG